MTSIEGEETGNEAWKEWLMLIKTLHFSTGRCTASRASQFWRNLYYLAMASSFSPRGDFQRIAPNGRAKVSVYVAMDYDTRKVHHVYQPLCNSEYTIDGLKFCLRLYHDFRALIIIWDKASWHTSRKVKQFIRRWNRYA